MTEIKITAEPQNDPQTCNFTVDREVTNGPSLRFHSIEEAKGSTLAEVIFTTGNISSLMISSKTITVTQTTSEDWRTMGRRIGNAIREAYSSGKPLLNKMAQDKIPTPDKIKKLVEEVFETEVNPALASHGGFIQLVGIKQNDITIKMGGGCQGCASSTATLRRGVEQTLRRHVPGLGFIFDATDHASGDNPYYQ